MSTDETIKNEQTSEPVEAPEASAETTEEPAGPKFSWEKREGFKIAETMKELIHKTIDASQSEIDSLRKKLEKLQYGG